MFSHPLSNRVAQRIEGVLVQLLVQGNVFNSQNAQLPSSQNDAAEVLHQHAEGLRLGHIPNDLREQRRKLGLEWDEHGQIAPIPLFIRTLTDK